jgi:putative FmdB family regulatory protein
MPTYSYKCPECGTELEKYLRIIHRDTAQLCPKCKAIMERLIGAGTSFYLKGSGWYKSGWNI